MKQINIKGMLSVGILLLYLLLMAGSTSAEIVVNTSIANGTKETYDVPDGELSNQSQGGYITEINITQLHTQTQNWQGFYGNVTGNIYLKGNSGLSMFNWTVDLSNTYVYATTNATGNNYSGLVNATPSELDTVWGFGNITDNINGTYLASDDDPTFVGMSLTNTYNATTAEGFLDYVIQDVPASPIKANIIWAAKIYEDKANFKGTTSDFQLLVPSKVQETYYFYLEI
jgi:hypothetical protein